MTGSGSAFGYPFTARQKLQLTHRQNRPAHTSLLQGQHSMHRRPDFSVQLFLQSFDGQIGAAPLKLA